MGQLFLTGGSGFLGRRLVPRLRQRGGGALTCLSRGQKPQEMASGVRHIQGDLGQPGPWRAALEGVDTVLHLAAATGTASAAEHRRVNVDGTGHLLAAARDAGVSRFLYVSSVAAAFRDVRRYPYARAKQQAEEKVCASGLPFVILRPTIILGPGAPVLAGLRRLARLPLVPLFGGGTARVQPVHVDDLALLIMDILDEDRFDGRTITLGGPDIITMRGLISEIGRLQKGRVPRMMSLPMGLPAGLLWAAERLGWRLPVTAGQLTSFVEDGVAPERQGEAAVRHPNTDLQAMLRQSLAEGGAP